ncbi:MAG: hypothetical protein BZ136_07445 [Methanosphaera sp. rholeuAM74]|nr:MAG: hypothetical protein BZ136_07445 [Methanosphaera sp. rholeuAM74]
MTTRQLGTATVNNGIARTQYTIPGNEQVGDYTLRGTYQQNDTYKEATATAEFKIRIATSITVDNVLANHNETATFTAHVLYENSNTVNTGQVQFKLGGQVIGTANVSGGLATLEYQVPSTVSTGDQITATYTGTSTYGTSTTITPAVIKIRETPSVLVQNVSVNRGDSIAIPITVEDENGDPISTGQMSVYIDNTLIDTVNISSSYTYTAPSNIQAGSHTVKVVYLQNEDYKSVYGTATLTIRAATRIVASNISANAGEQTPLQVTVYDEHNVIVTEGQVTFTGPSGDPANVAVANDGTATTNIEIDSIANDGSTYNYTAVFNQTSNYEASTQVTIVVTVRTRVVITLADVTANRGDIIYLSATVEDNSGNEVDTGTVTYELID